MAMPQPPPVRPADPFEPALPSALNTWLAGLSWEILLLFMPITLLALGLELGVLAGRSHG